MDMCIAIQHERFFKKKKSPFHVNPAQHPHTHDLTGCNALPTYLLHLLRPLEKQTKDTQKLVQYDRVSSRQVV